MKRQTFCNPLDLSYRYQHMLIQGERSVFREGADPTLIFYKGTYYIFVSMASGFWYSKDLLDWKFHGNKDLLIYDYAPDVRQVGDYLYFCASRRGVNCPILRSANPLEDDFEEVSAPFDFWDPDMFCDDDGRVYFYWGCSNMDPIFGVEMDQVTMTPIGDPVPLLEGHEDVLGYERAGENGVVLKEGGLYEFIASCTNPETGEFELPEHMPDTAGFTRERLMRMVKSAGRPYIEGAFMTKHNGKYYLQYAVPGTQFNTYADGVYVSDTPLGPFTVQSSNPYSSKPGGFIHAAGHGSTIADAYGNYWHASTMRISVNHNFERRVGLFPAGFDEDGILFCNQNFADYPMRIPEGKFDPWSIKPEWMLLSYQKPATASSTAEGSNVKLAVDEDIRSWWSAATNKESEWYCVDLEKQSEVHAIQVNLADENLAVEYPEDIYGGSLGEKRYIEQKPVTSSYRIEMSLDGEAWSVLEEVSRECSNGYYEYLDGIMARYIRITGAKLPYGQPLRISGLRVFGTANGSKPEKAKAKAIRTGDLDGLVSWEPIDGAQGCNVRYGIAPDKLYCSWMVYRATEVNLSTLIKGQEYYICVDSFNENGITEGDVIRMM